MRRATVLVALALVLVLSGCNGLVGPGGSAATETVTPAPVPSVASPRDDSAGRGCLVPPPPSPDRSPAAPPAEPRALPLENGSIEGDRLVEVHDRSLPNYSYALTAEGLIEVRALAGARAFSYRGLLDGIPYVQAYGVGGTLYTLERDRNGDPRVRERPYERESLAREYLLPSLTAKDWLEDRVGEYEYELVDTRTWNGTRVRVFKREFDRGRQVVRRKVAALDSTLYVDDRGIIRYADHDTKFRPIENPEGTPEWHNGTLRVTDLGTARVHRPAGFCGFDRAPLEPTRSDRPFTP